MSLLALLLPLRSVVRVPGLSVCQVLVGGGVHLAYLQVALPHDAVPVVISDVVEQAQQAIGVYPSVGAEYSSVLQTLLLTVLPRVRLEPADGCQYVRER